MESSRVHTDENGKRWLLDANGAVVLDERGQPVPAMYSLPASTASGWTVYDTTQGHCALCGRLTCRGECFR